MVEPTGYTALDLIGFTDKGPYDPTANYVRNDLVHVGNSTWRCKIDDTTGITPTEGANWTIFIESATSLSGMSDVDLNTPKAGDGLVHDGNDWTNIPIMTKEQWKKNGAYNQCPNTWTTQVKGGLTFTRRSDGTIAPANGSPNNNIYVTPISNFAPVHLPVGRYKMVAFPDTGITGTKNFYFVNVTTNTAYLITDNDGIFDVTDASHEWYCAYGFDSTTVFNDAVLYPMMTTDLNATYADYVPYAKTNEELTEDIKITTYTKTTDATGECSIGSDSAYVPIGGSIVGTQNTHTGAVSFRTASSDRNTYYAMFYSATSSALNVVANKELTFIVVWVKKS